MWVAREVMPHERRVRDWLRRHGVKPEEADEVIQDSYCRLSMLESVDHIDRPDAYFFSVARNLLIRRIKRQQVVPIETLATIEASHADETPSPEQQTAARIEFARTMDFMARLPERCREIIRLRKIEGWSQKQIAAHLGITEKAVEKQIWVGVKAIRTFRQRVEASGAAHLREALPS